MNVPRNTAEFLKIKRWREEGTLESNLNECKQILDWANLPIAQRVREKISKKVEDFEKKMLTGRCKSFEEYLGCVYARKKGLSFEDVIKDTKDLYNKITAKQESESK